jgi:hypothetical protein
MNLKHTFIVMACMVLFSCSEDSSNQKNSATASSNTPDCCKELENVKNELRSAQLELELLRLQLMVMEDSMAKIKSNKK